MMLFKFFHNNVFVEVSLTSTNVLPPALLFLTRGLMTSLLNKRQFFSLFFCDDDGEELDEFSDPPTNGKFIYTHNNEYFY